MEDDPKKAKHKNKYTSFISFYKNASFIITVSFQYSPLN